MQKLSSDILEHYSNNIAIKVVEDEFKILTKNYYKKIFETVT